jgi:hypothetical protein
MMNRGSALDGDGAYLMCRARPTVIVAMAGPIKSGKTTLIASIHQGFQFPPVCSFAFKRSKTLVGFEEKTYASRAASGALETKTPRTSFAVGQEYYHLWLRSRAKSQLEPQALFLDMSGEYFERSLDSSEEARQLTVLKRANFFAVLLDGRRLASRVTEQSARQNSVALVRRIIEEKLLSAECLIQILITKVDLLLPEFSEGLLAAWMKDIDQDYLRFKDRKISLAGIAASPKPGSPWPLRFGVADLVDTWFSHTDFRVAASQPVSIKSSRLADRIAARWLPENYQ